MWGKLEGFNNALWDYWILLFLKLWMCCWFTISFDACFSFTLVNHLQGKFILKICSLVRVHVMASAVVCNQHKHSIREDIQKKCLLLPFRMVRPEKYRIQCSDMLMRTVYCSVFICIHLGHGRVAGMIMSIMSNIEVSACFTVLHHFTPC